MTRYPQTARACLTKMITHMRQNYTCAEKTLEFYDYTCRSAIAILEQIGGETLPYKLKERDIKRFLEYMEKERYAIVTRKGYTHALSRLCRHYGNDVVERMRIRWPHDTRPTVDWLTTEQVRAIMEYKKTPLQAMGIHCMLQLGMRRIEAIRLRISDINMQARTLSVLGKGPQGGKPRLIPFHPKTREVLTVYLVYRDDLIQEARRHRPISTVVPDNLFINYRGRMLHPYDEDGWGWDKSVIVPIRKDLGFQFSNHTLRRTFGRLMWRAGIPLVTLSKLMGHEDVAITMKYIGVDIDDMVSAMEMCPI